MNILIRFIFKNYMYRYLIENLYFVVVGSKTVIVCNSGNNITRLGS